MSSQSGPLVNSRRVRGKEPSSADPMVLVSPRSNGQGHHDETHPPKKLCFRHRLRLLQSVGCFLLGVCLEHVARSIWTSPQVLLQLDTVQEKHMYHPSISNKVDTIPSHTNSGATQSIHRTTTTSNNKTKIVFLFVIGLEGTGHHLLNQIFKSSPLEKRLFQTLNLENYHHQLQQMFHNFHIVRDRQKQIIKTGKGLWNAHCGEFTDKGPVVRKAKSRSSSIGGSTSSSINTMQLQSSIQRHMQVIATKVHQAQQQQLHDTNAAAAIVYYPINTMGKSPNIGMASYPNCVFDVWCRFLNYASMDLWYDSICSQMTKQQSSSSLLFEIDCQHLYLYRNPLAVVNSATVLRRFNPTVISALHEYETMLHIIYMQLETFQDETFDCFGFLNPPSTPTSTTTNNSTSSRQQVDWRTVMQEVGAWNNDSVEQSSDSFKTFINDSYKTPKPINETQLLMSLSTFMPSSSSSRRRLLSSSSYIPNNDNNNHHPSSSWATLYLKPLQRLHVRAVRRCHENLLNK